MPVILVWYSGGRPNWQKISVTQPQPIAGSSGACLSSQAKKETEIRRITVPVNKDKNISL
jgi:hypothetical protein